MRSMTAVAIGIAAVLLLVVAVTGSGRLTGLGFGWGDPDDGCELAQDATEGSDVAVRSTCRWEHVSAERLQGLLGDPAVHRQVFSNLAESTILEERPGWAKVYQVHQASGMSDREIVVEFRTEEIHGGYRYHWEKSADQSANTGERVEVEASSGYWEVVSDGDGARLEHHLRYLPGGNIPAFLVRMGQGPGIRAMLAELRSTAESDTVIVRAQ